MVTVETLSIARMRPSLRDQILARTTGLLGGMPVRYIGKNGPNAHDVVPVAAPFPAARNRARAAGVWAQPAAGRISAYRCSPRLALANRGGAACFLGHGGDGTLPGAPLDLV